MENETIIMAIWLLVLSVASGMRGLGVAFAAVSFLGFFPSRSGARGAAALIIPQWRHGALFAVRFRAQPPRGIETGDSACGGDNTIDLGQSHPLISRYDC